MSEQLKAALIRSTVGGLIGAASIALSTWATTDDPKTVLIAAGTAFLAPFLARGVGEGFYDQQRQTHGTVKPSDVGHTLTTATTHRDVDLATAPAA